MELLNARALWKHRCLLYEYFSVMKAASAQEIKEQLKANTDEVMRRGGFGSPTMYLGDDMYFGNDRLSLLRDAVLRGRG